jgi:hypothetical protein
MCAADSTRLILLSQMSLVSRIFSEQGMFLTSEWSARCQSP